MEKTETTEQATQATPQKPSGISEALQNFVKSQETEQAESKPSEQETKTEEQKTEEHEQKTEERKEESVSETPKDIFRFVDKEGKDVPFDLKVDGQDITLDLTKPEDLNKLRTWGQLGYHGNTRNESLKERESSLDEREKKIQQGETMLNMIQQAISDGRIKINPKTGEVGGQPETTEEEDDAYVEPEIRSLRQENRQLKEQLGSLGTKVDSMNKLLFSKVAEEAGQKMDAEIDAALEKNPIVKSRNREHVYNLLAMVDKGGKPVYTPDTAVEKLANEMKSEFTTWAKENPKFQEASEEQRKKIIAEYLEGEQKKTQAPVQSPSTQTAGRPVPQEGEHNIKGITDALDKFSKYLTESKSHAAKS